MVHLIKAMAFLILTVTSLIIIMINSWNGFPGSIVIINKVLKEIKKFAQIFNNCCLKSLRY